MKHLTKSLSLVLSGEPLDNIPRSAKEEGHKILAVEQVEGDIYKILIERAGREIGENAG
ncbi:MAG: hypothetical protein LBR93_10280 [Treponema sp.]|nr:hypothetical protein [Treponema sp.]